MSLATHSAIYAASVGPGSTVLKIQANTSGMHDSSLLTARTLGYLGTLQQGGEDDPGLHGGVVLGDDVGHAALQEA